MSNEENGGPAFPLHNHGTQTLGMHLSGMTLRDYFAGQVLGSVYASFIKDIYSGHCPYADWENGVAAYAYRMADAMLKARKESK